jgi:hypothetical protein
MSQAAVVRIGDLARGLVLAPERYDPRRRFAPEMGAALTDVSQVVNEQVSAASGTPGAMYLVLDTGDARGGVISTARQPVNADRLGSSKKRFRSGDVIISRLRPYLRQVAYVDDELAPSGTEIVGSTEFYVLRSPDRARSIAFLAAYLLSNPVQVALAAAQEGGHHPRFAAETLGELRIPDKVIANRDAISRSVEDAVRSARTAERRIAEALAAAAG